MAPEVVHDYMALTIDYQQLFAKYEDLLVPMSPGLDFLHILKGVKEDPAAKAAKAASGGPLQVVQRPDLPPTREKATWKIGSAVDVEWSIYANHGGGYSYRLCKKVQGKDATEECFQRTPLDFASDSTTIKYYDGSRAPFDIKAAKAAEK